MQIDLDRAMAFHYREAFKGLERLIVSAEKEEGKDPLRLVDWMKGTVEKCCNQLTQGAVSRLIELADGALHDLVNDWLVDVCHRPLVGKAVIVEEMVWEEATWLRYRALWEGCYPGQGLYHPLQDRLLVGEGAPYPLADGLIGWLHRLHRQIIPAEFLSQKEQLPKEVAYSFDEEWLLSYTTQIGTTFIEREGIEECADQEDSLQQLIGEMVESLQMDADEEEKALAIFEKKSQRSMAVQKARIEESFADYCTEVSSRREELSTFIAVRGQEQGQLQTAADQNAEKLEELSWKNHQQEIMLERFKEQRQQNWLSLEQAKTLADGFSVHHLSLSRETDVQGQQLQEQARSLAELDAEIRESQGLEKKYSVEIFNQNSFLGVLENKVKETSEQLRTFAGRAGVVRGELVRTESAKGGLLHELQLLRQQSYALSGQLNDIDDSSCTLL